MQSSGKTRAVVVSTAGTAVLMLAAVYAMAHTRLETPAMMEGVRAMNNVVIGHGCGAKGVIGTSVVFPDGTDSTITINGVPYDGPLSDFVTNWGPNIQPVQSKALFDHGGVKTNPLGNRVGFWAGGGEPLDPAMLGLVPFRVNATNLAPQSCASSVRFWVSIVDVCEITGVDELQYGGHDGGSVGLWTHHDLGTPYDAATSGGPASLVINRNTASNPLPASCGAGFEVQVKPSATQIERDMPIFYQGIQIWPEP